MRGLWEEFFTGQEHEATRQATRQERSLLQLQGRRVQFQVKVCTLKLCLSHASGRNTRINATVKVPERVRF